MTTEQFANAKLRSLEKLCRSQGLALTVQRRVILETLAARIDHPTADQIYDVVKGVLKGISRTTVYRVLETFVRMGVVTRVSNPQAKTRFDADVTRHHHLICLSCEAVSDWRDEFLQGITIPEFSLLGFQVKEVSLCITGVCAECSKGKD